MARRWYNQKGEEASALPEACGIVKTRQNFNPSRSEDRDMATPAFKLQLTYEDYLLFPDDGRRHELIGGEHYVTPAPSEKHQIAAGNLHLDLGMFVRTHGLGRVFFAPYDLVLSDQNVVQPDLLFISHQRGSVAKRQGIGAIPELVIEILSESNRKTDETTKRKLYEWAGVLEYWIVDPLLETVKIYRLDGGAYERVAELSVEAGDRLETPLLPGLTIALARIFE
jgi:Uma2 family endonuclease